jgi:hypothetical protein
MEQWASEKSYDERDWLYEFHIATRAAQWGADQELEACCEWLDDYLLAPKSGQLRTARRPEPKPPSLKERSLQLLETYDTSGVMLTADQVDTIKRALEALND